MASIAKEIVTNASAEQAWDALRDIGALHTRLVPGFVTDTKLISGGRRVTFANGLVVEEPIIGVNENMRRIAWTARGEGLPLEHYSAAAQVFPREAGGCRIVWTADLLPDSAAAMVNEMMEQGAAAMTRALNRLASTAR